MVGVDWKEHAALAFHHHFLFFFDETRREAGADGSLYRPLGRLESLAVRPLDSNQLIN